MEERKISEDETASFAEAKNGWWCVSRTLPRIPPCQTVSSPANYRIASVEGEICNFTANNPTNEIPSLALPKKNPKNSSSRMIYRFSFCTKNSTAIIVTRANESHEVNEIKKQLTHTLRRQTTNWDYFMKRKHARSLRTNENKK